MLWSTVVAVAARQENLDVPQSFRCVAPSFLLKSGIRDVRRGGNRWLDDLAGDGWCKEIRQE
jgi:hypothetical protein